MNIHFETLDLLGHTNPARVLIDELTSRGHKVQWFRHKVSTKPGSFLEWKERLKQIARESPPQPYLDTDLLITDPLILHARKVREQTNIPWLMFGNIPLIVPHDDVKVLMASYPEMEPDAKENVCFIGPLIPQETQTFIPPPRHTFNIHVTQGTLQTKPEDLIMPAMKAQQMGWGGSWSGEWGRGKNDETFVVHHENLGRYIPHNQLFPFIDLLITNGGFGGVNAALAAGVPIILCGDTEEKPVIGERIENCGVGIFLKTNPCDPRTLRWAIDEIRDNPSFTETARRFKSSWLTQDAPRRAVDYIEALNNNIFTKTELRGFK